MVCSHLDIAVCGFWAINVLTLIYGSSIHTSDLIFYHHNQQQKRWNMTKGCMMMYLTINFIFLHPGGCGSTTDVVLKKLASCIATHKGKSYSCWLIGFSLIQSVVLCLGGCHSFPIHLFDHGPSYERGAYIV